LRLAQGPDDFSQAARMSEYQYYEFLAINRPLDRAAQDALRSISSRAQITPTSFINHYEWGDLKDAAHPRLRSLARLDPAGLEPATRPL
jgi:hypothetical protein